MNKLALLLVLCLFAALCLLPAEAHGQQEQAPHIALEWPNEGETLYAGPTSLLYSVPVKGYVTNVDDAHFPLTVQLEIIQDGRVMESDQQSVNQSGHFSFFVTVNPDASEGQFPAENSGCAASCHFPSNISLPSGPVELQLSIVKPAHLTDITAQRHITVDRSAYVTIPFNLIPQGEDATIPAGVNVAGATRLYMWRARHALAATDDQGQAQLRVEALSQAPTEYLVQVQPTIVGGVLYEGIEEHRVTLEPGAHQSDPINLTVTARQGQLDGSLTQNVPGSPQVWAVCLPDGHSFQAPVNTDGSFHFANLPLQPYRLTLDPQSLARSGYEAEAVDVDLTESIEREVTLSVESSSAPTLLGAVRDEQGAPLPFAWVSAGEEGPTVPVLPDSGHALLPDFSTHDKVLFARAPGYYSRAQVLNDGSPEATQTVTLTPLPETRFVPWGNGAITVPAGSVVETTQQIIDLQRGWLWGQGNAGEPLTIQAGDVHLTISSTRFALEYLPQRKWFYLLEGTAQIESASSPEPVTLQAPAMLNLGLAPQLAPAPYDPVVIRALQTAGQAPPAATWEPSLSARLRDGLARLGIGAAQLFAFVTYALICLSIVAVPFLYLYQRRRTKSQTR